MTASQRRELVLHAALIEFAARGLDGASAQDIAHGAGISQPYLFRLFPTKKALFLTVVSRCFQQMTEVFAAAAEETAMHPTAVMNWPQATMADLRDRPSVGARAAKSQAGRLPGSRR
jgi:AcrR family transcriptional regulator